MLAVPGLLLAFGQYCLAAEGQPPSVLLWPDGAPGAVGETDADKPVLFVHTAKPQESVGTAVIVCPGGGYRALMMSYEGHEVAEWFNSFGVTAFVLKYRLSPRYLHPAPLQDVQRAIRYVRSRADHYGISPERIGVMGFSAGGHLAATAGTLFDKGKPDAEDPIERVSCRPDFMILCYAVIALEGPHGHRMLRDNLLGKQADPEVAKLLSSQTQVTRQTPPAFLLQTDADKVVPAEHSVLFYLALRQAKVPAEMHVYQPGPHGVGLKRHPVTATWPNLARNWMNSMGWLKPARE
jgi:acetyl esterase/lipase